MYVAMQIKSPAAAAAAAATAVAAAAAAAAVAAVAAAVSAAAAAAAAAAAGPITQVLCWGCVLLLLVLIFLKHRHARFWNDPQTEQHVSLKKWGISTTHILTQGFLSDRQNK